MEVLKTRIDLLNGAQEVGGKLLAELEEESQRHVVDAQNLQNHMAYEIESLQREKEEKRKEKEELATKLQAMENEFFQADAAIKVFGKKAVTIFFKGFLLARMQVLEKNPDADLSGLMG